jgi:phosphonoacetaldehyde hydrolase
LEQEAPARMLAAASERLYAAGADLVIDTVADLVPALEAEAARRAA